MEETACFTIRDTARSFPIFMHAEIVTVIIYLTCILKTQYMCTMAFSHSRLASVSIGTNNRFRCNLGIVEHSVCSYFIRKVTKNSIYNGVACGNHLRQCHIRSCANPLVVKCLSCKWRTFHPTNIQNSNDFKEQKMCIKGRATPWVYSIQLTMRPVRATICGTIELPLQGRMGCVYPLPRALPWAMEILGFQPAFV